MNARPIHGLSLNSIIVIVFLLTLPTTLEQVPTLNTMSAVNQVPQTKQTCSDGAAVDRATPAEKLDSKVSQCKLETKLGLC
jgi:hypothetical protein